MSQEDVTCTGHALEARIYAENPAAGFLPGSGKLTYLKEPSGEHVRVDTGVVVNDVVRYGFPRISSFLSACVAFTTIQ